jgi:hypothetical protein
MKVKVSINHGPGGSSRADFDVPFVPGKTTVGQVLQDAASRLVAAGGVSKGKSDDEENGPPILTLDKAPSKVETVSDQYIGQDWIKNRVGQSSKSIRYHVVPALVTSDEDDSDDDSAADGCELRMIGGRHPKHRTATTERRAVLSSKLYEYHALEGLAATAWSKIEAISIPLDFEGSSALRINFTPTGEIRGAVKMESTRKGGMVELGVLDLDLPESPGGATFADLKTVGKTVHVLRSIAVHVL